jgi:hypothetical protein
VRHPFVRVQFQNGVPMLLFGERAFLPMLFFGNPYTTDAGVRVHQQMQLACEAGVHLYSLLITLPVRDTGAIEAFDQIRYWTALDARPTPTRISCGGLPSRPSASGKRSTPKP